VWASPALPGSIHDLKAARTHGLVDALTRTAVAALADKGYRAPAARSACRSAAAACPAGSARSTQRTRRSAPSANAPSPRSKTWRLLTKLRCCPQRATALVAAILTVPARFGAGSLTSRS
jgi:hypothetical protein